MFNFFIIVISASKYDNNNQQRKKKVVILYGKSDTVMVATSYCHNMKIIKTYKNITHTLILIDFVYRDKKNTLLCL